MRSFFIIAVFGVAILHVAAHANAGFMFVVDMDRNTSGVQSTVTAQSGSLVEADLLLRLTGTSTLSSYNVSMRFDVGELTFVSRSFDLPPGPLLELDTSDRNPAANGLPLPSSGSLFRFDGATLGSGLITPGDFVISRMSFLVSNPVGTSTDVDLIAGLFESPFDSVFDAQLPFGNDVSNQVVFVGGSVISAVPEPSSFLFCSLALILGSPLAWFRKQLVP